MPRTKTYLRGHLAALTPESSQLVATIVFTAPSRYGWGGGGCATGTQNKALSLFHVQINGSTILCLVVRSIINSIIFNETHSQESV